jgi:hypothetical protein
VLSNTCLWGIPPAYSGHGRPRKHGEKFQLIDETTWTLPDESIELATSSCGRVKVRMWKDLHFVNAANNQINLILVERLEPTGSGRIIPPLWLVTQVASYCRSSPRAQLVYTFTTKMRFVVVQPLVLKTYFGRRQIKGKISSSHQNWKKKC